MENLTGLSTALHIIEGRFLISTDHTVSVPLAKNGTRCTMLIRASVDYTCPEIGEGGLGV